MVRYINPHKDNIKKIMSNDFERLSREGARSLSLLKDTKGKSKTYKYNVQSSSIIIEKTNLTNLELIEKVLKEFDFYISEFITEPVRITTPLSYVDARSIINGKYNNILKKFNYTVNQVYNNSTDRLAVFHSIALIENIRPNPKGLTLSDHMLKRVSSIQKLFIRMNWFIDLAENSKDRWGRSQKYNLNYVFYELLNGG